MLQYLFDELEVGNIISFGLEYLEKDRLPLYFAFSECLACFRGNEMIPLFIFLCEFAILEPSKTFF